MAYTPKTWQCGETIMADDLNHMEQGIAQSGSVLTVNVVDTDPALNSAKSEAPLLRGAGTPDYWLDKTWQQIYDAFPNVRVNAAYARSATSGFQIVSEIVNTVSDGCVVRVGATSSEIRSLTIGTYTFVAETTDGYPKLQ